MNITEEELRALCKILSNHNSNSEIDRFLASAGIKNLGNPTKTVQNGFGYIIGDSKENKLYKSFYSEYRANGINKILIYIEKVAAPIQFTDDEKRKEYKYFVESINKALLFLGCKLNDSGKLVTVEAANTLSEVDERVNHLRKELLNRNIHSEVLKYCAEDLLRKDYFDAINEAVKGTFERVRKITGLTNDGCELLQDAFAQNKPYLYFNKQQTKSEWNEHNGLKELMQSLFHLVRNPLSHTPKISWNIKEEYALDVLTVASLIHKYLDECHKHPAAP